MGSEFLIETIPADTSTTHILPFNRLSPADFERMCLWLVEREGYECVQHLGASGNEQGRDIVAWRDGELWAFQCKNVQRFGPTEALEEVDKVLALPGDERPKAIMFLVTCRVSSLTRQKARERCADAMECDFWTYTELDMRVRQHGDILETFFGIPQKAGSLSSEDYEQLLAKYRERMLRETEFVSLTGIPLPRGRDGRPLPLQMPLDEVYIQIQALAEEKKQVTEGGEEQAGEESAAQLSFRGQRSKPHGTRRDAKDRQRDEFPLDPYSEIRILGEYFYRRNDVFQAEKRPEPVAPEAALQEHRRLVILGAPGSGKSTLLRYLARQAAASPDKALPIRVSLRDYATALATNPTLSLRDFALDTTCAGDERLRVALTQATEDGSVLWLVDALDEARAWRGQVARHVSVLSGDVILTSRPAGYERTMLERFAHFEILPLSLDDVNQFLNNWFAVLAAQRETGRIWIEEHVSWLNAQLDLRPQIQPLTRNPLLLTFLVVLAGDEPSKELPTHRAELYRCYVDELLNTWEAHRRPRATAAGEPVFSLGPLQGAQARQAARRSFYLIGWHLHRAYHGGKGALLPTRTALPAALEDTLKADWDLAPQVARTLAEDSIAFWEEAGILDCWRVGGKDYMAFRHLTFQEYAAAHYLARAWETKRVRTWAFLRPRLHHYAWREPLLLMSGLLEDATPLARHILRARSRYERELHRDLLLVADLIGEGSAVSSVFVERVVGRATRLAMPISIGVRRAALATVWLVGLGLFVVMFPRPLVPIVLWSLAWLVMAATYIPCARSLMWWPLHLLDLAARQPQAVSALGRIGAPAVEPLIRILCHSDLRAHYDSREQNVRLLAAEELGRIGDARAVEHLVLASEDQDQGVSRAAVDALGQIGAPAVEPLLQLLTIEDWGVGRQAVDALAKIDDPQSIELFARAMSHSEERIRSAARSRLEKIGDRAVESLTRELQAGDEGTHWEFVLALGRIGGSKVTEHLVSALRHQSASVRSTAATALGRNGDPETIAALVNALGDENRWAQSSVVGALEQMGEPAVGPLVQALSDDQGIVRQAAKQTLGQIGLPAAEALLKALEHEKPLVRQSAVEAFGHMAEMQARGAGGQRQSKDAAVGGVTPAVCHEISALALQPLIRKLEDEQLSVRRAAVMALGQFGDRNAVVPLIEVLETAEWKLRYEATVALGKIADPKAVPSLIKALANARRLMPQIVIYNRISEQRDSEPYVTVVFGFSGGEVREGAARALGQIGDVQAIDPLVQALQDEEPSVRRIVAEALGKIGDAQAVEPLVRVLADGSCWVRRKAAVALGCIGDPRAVEPLMDALADQDRSVQQGIVLALGQLGQPLASAALLPLLECDDVSLRQTTVEALGPVGDVQAVGPLIERLRDRQEAELVRRSAAEALGTFGDSQAAEPLIDVLKDDQDGQQVRRAAAKALGEIEDPRAMTALIEAVGYKDWSVAHEAAEALGHIGAAAVDQLLHLLTDAEWRVRDGAARALEVIGAPAVEPLVQTWRRESTYGRHPASDILQKIGAPAIKPLLRLLAALPPESESAIHRDFMLGSQVRESLKAIRDPEAIQQLLEALGDKDPAMRCQAALRLADRDASDVSPFLLEALADPDASVRRSVVAALGRLGDLQAVGPLVDTMADESPEVRRATAWALANSGDSHVVLPLIDLLDDAASQVRQAAANALGRMSDLRAMDPLLDALHDGSPEVREAASEALAQLGNPRAVAPLIQMLGDDAENVRRAAAKALGQLGDPQAVAPLIRTLRDRRKRVRWPALNALEEIGDPEAIEPLRRALWCGDELLRTMATPAIGNLISKNPIGSLRLARQVARALWWRLLDQLFQTTVHAYYLSHVTDAAMSLERTVTRMTELEVRGLDAADPLALASSSRGHHLTPKGGLALALAVAGILGRVSATAWKGNP